MSDRKTYPYADVRLETMREEIEAAIARRLEGRGYVSRFRDRRRKRKESEALLRR